MSNCKNHLTQLLAEAGDVHRLARDQAQSLAATRLDLIRQGLQAGLPAAQAQALVQGAILEVQAAQHDAFKRIWELKDLLPGWLADPA